MENGNLVIEARREEYRGSDYTSGSLTTRSTRPILYGRIEIRAKMPEGNGLWAALWMLGYENERVTWPTVGEIDIVEYLGMEPEKLYFTLHSEERNHMRKNEVQACLPAEKISSDYHVYTADWTPDRITIYYDGQQVLTHKKEKPGMASWPYFNPMYLRMNLAVGGAWGGLRGIDDKALPQKMLVDYVRLYQAVPTE